MVSQEDGDRGYESLLISINLKLNSVATVSYVFGCTKMCLYETFKPDCDMFTTESLSLTPGRPIMVSLPARRQAWMNQLRLYNC